MGGLKCEDPVTEQWPTNGQHIHQKFSAVPVETSLLFAQDLSYRDGITTLSKWYPLQMDFCDAALFAAGGVAVPTFVWRESRWLKMIRPSWNPCIMRAFMFILFIYVWPLIGLGPASAATHHSDATKCQLEVTRPGEGNRSVGD